MEPSSIGPKWPIRIDQEGPKVFAKDIMRKDKIPTTGDGKTFKSLPTGQSQKRIVQGKERQNIRDDFLHVIVFSTRHCVL